MTYHSIGETIGQKSTGSFARHRINVMYMNESIHLVFRHVKFNTVFTSDTRLREHFVAGLPGVESLGQGFGMKEIPVQELRTFNQC